MFTNQMRFTGFSGVDTESMVRQIMNAESMRLHRFQRNRQMAVWRQEDYRGVRASLQYFQSRFLDLTQTGPDSMSLRLSQVMLANRVNVSGTGDATGLNVSVAAHAPQGTFNVTVESALRAGSVAGHRLNSTIVSPSEFNLDAITSRNVPTTIRVGLNDHPDDRYAQTIDLAAIARRVIDADPNANEASFIDELQSELNSIFGVTNQGFGRVVVGLNAAGHVMFDTALASDRITLTNEAPGSLATLGGLITSNNTIALSTTMGTMLGAGSFQDGVAQISINGTSIDIQESWTIQQTMNAINNSEAGVNMSFNAATQSFFIVNDRVGAGNNVTFGNTVNDQAFQLTFLGNTIQNLDPEQVVLGQNAEITVTTPIGQTFSLEQSDGNVFSFNGLDVNITGATVGGQFEVNVARDTERVRNIVETFVEQYNDLVRELSTLRQTARPLGAGGSVFDPRLTHEGEGLTDREIELWDEQARQGMLHRSREIERALSEMRDAITGGINVDGRIVRLSDFGINHVRARNEEEYGTVLVLEINEERLDYAFANFSPEQIHSFFSQMGNELNTSINESAGRIANHAGGTALTNSGNALQMQIRDMDRRISSMEDRLTRREEHLFLMFSRMESAIMQANAQMDFLFMMMGG
ncbi:MAG: flagellar filament capping protein FliD [Defluviitaleaceae bacterium]|nr:flagellar filament capping protein FliD [Defluviitaleaceae bacterium]